MAALPRPVRDFIARHSRQSLRPAFLKVATAGTILEVGGDPAYYGLDDLAIGAAASEAAAFLAGLLPLTEHRFTIEQLQMATGTVADVHLLRGRGHDWVVLLDATDASRSRQLVQQRGNDLSLLRSVHGRLLDRWLAQGGADGEAPAPPVLDPSGERRVASALVAELKGVTRLAETAEPAAVLATVDLALRAMTNAIVSSAGLIDSVLGTGLVAVFGLLPSTVASEDPAIRAAHRLGDEVARVHSGRRRRGPPPVEPAVAIATGPLVVGLSSRDRRSFTALGYHLDLAKKLAGQARPGEILIDPRTRAGASETGHSFAPHHLDLPELGGGMEVFTVVRSSP